MIKVTQEQRVIYARNLRLKREKEGFETAADFARSVGVKEVTYTSHENGTRGIPLNMARLYASKLKMDITELFPLSGEEAGLLTVSSVPVVGEVSMGVWRHTALDTAELNENKRALNIPQSRSGPMRYCVEIKDNSVNRYLSAGEFAVCTSIDNDEAVTLDKALLHVERDRSGVKERAIWRAEKGPGGDFMMSAHSTDSRHQEIWRYPSVHPGETVRIIGKVVGKYAEGPAL
jgi:DNA-binding XRE family transcriptional regulator